MLSILLLLAAAPTCDVVGTDVSLRAVDVSVPRLKTA
jgi:methylase of polypeptide subunit release factors